MHERLFFVMPGNFLLGLKRLDLVRRNMEMLGNLLNRHGPGTPPPAFFPELGVVVEPP